MLLKIAATTIAVFIAIYLAILLTFNVRWTALVPASVAGVYVYQSGSTSSTLHLRTNGAFTQELHTDPNNDKATSGTWRLSGLDVEFRDLLIPPELNDGISGESSVYVGPIKKIWGKLSIIVDPDLGTCFKMVQGSE